MEITEAAIFCKIYRAQMGMVINNWLILGMLFIELSSSLALEQEIVIDELHVSVFFSGLRGLRRRLKVSQLPVGLPWLYPLESS